MAVTGSASTSDLPDEPGQISSISSRVSPPAGRKTRQFACA